MKICALNFISTKGSRFEAHQHAREFELHYILEGTGAFQNGPKVLRIDRGSLCFSPPGTVHGASLDRLGERLSFYFLRFVAEIEEDRMLLARLRRRVGSASMIKIGSGPRMLFEEMRHKFSSGEEMSQGSARHLFLSFLYDLGRAQARFSTGPGTGALLERAVALLQGAVNDKLTSQELASRLHHSGSYLIRIFRREYGVSPMKYLASLKMETARHLLESTELPIYHIAEMLAYYDEFHFSKTFKRLAGISPSDYRRSFRQRPR